MLIWTTIWNGGCRAFKLTQATSPLTSPEGEGEESQSNQL